MNIVVLDGHTLNPGDLSWDGLAALGRLKVFDRTKVEEIVARAERAEVVLTNKTPLNRETIRHLTALKYIGVLATGYNVVNAEAARKRGVTVTNVPGYATDSVAQLVFAFLLEFASGVHHHAMSVRKGRWTKNPDFCYWNFPLQELAGLNFGLIGYGGIGRAVARRAVAFGMNVLAHTPHPPELPVEGVTFVDLDRVFRESDVVSLHCPLSTGNERMVNAYRLEQMKPSAYLINTARGGLVDEAALAAALESGRLAGAGLDVLSEEPPDAKNPLLNTRNCLITPHQAWATTAARARLMDGVVANVRAFLDGKPQNVVN
jgi:glycerate dehydrogenase